VDEVVGLRERNTTIPGDLLTELTSTCYVNKDETIYKGITLVYKKIAFGGTNSILSKSFLRAQGKMVTSYPHSYSLAMILLGQIIVL
jgi:hypothetical protein